MNKHKIEFNTFFLAIFFCFFLFVPNTRGASYDYYVDSGYSGESDGSKDKPFDKISDAIKNGSKKAKIFIKKGKYAENIVIDREVSLFGESKGKVFLSGGTLEVKKNSSLSNVTIEGGSTAIHIDSGADMEINNCIIKKFGKIGIDALPGDGKVAVRNSSIYGGSGKGLYIEQGREIRISESRIYGNKEEGVDIRAKTKGFIKNNDIYDNGESGIEIIIGSSEVVISGNSINNNGASGIASQFYEGTQKIGEIAIKNNNISKNKKYGLDCSFPSGGSPKPSYWGDSLSLSGNNIKDNGMRSINNFCKIIDAVDEREEKVSNATDENNNLKSKEEVVLSNEKVQDDKIRIEEAIWENTENIDRYQGESEIRIGNRMEKINSVSRWKVFFVGNNQEDLHFIKKEIEINKEQLNRLRDDLRQIENEEAKNGIFVVVDRVEKNIKNGESFVAEKENKKGIFGWFRKIFSS
ncbi:MAG TPA: hypothetical protein DIC35_04660 [Candidatus Moranbacteria bacterium]|nr:hypothetical protein [Candidatus Moranbacteria bacterium]